ncbi:unnamed protein product [Clonostachys chloroleuca]|uniref:Uncharacterized protein n=1 Tax=Clonostachys chloroleuca TaxID=1926264 RepID=A0AA35LXJ7_9HYPO|nr:unnamed protein product [Clonostachys chloroleuca]
MTGSNPRNTPDNSSTGGTITITMPSAISPEIQASLSAMRNSQPPPSSLSSSSAIVDPRIAHPLRPPHKRMRSEAPDSPTTTAVSHAPAAESLGSSKRSRDLLFDSVVANNESAEFHRTIQSPDDLGKAELLKCFEILHACGRATVPDASLAVTRKSIEGFLEAIFNGWANDQEKELVKPSLEFRADADVVAGHICGKDVLRLFFSLPQVLERRELADLIPWFPSTAFPQEHSDTSNCATSNECKAEFSAIATYSTENPGLKVEFVISKQVEGEDPVVLSPLMRRDMRWLETEWPEELRIELKRKLMGRLHKYNKHVALWKARKLVQGWIKGDSTDVGVGGSEFLGPHEADAAMMGFGKAA